MNANAPATQPNNREQAIENRIDQDFARAMPLAAAGRGNLFVPQTFGEAMEFAKMMAVSGPMVGKSFRLNPGACLAISMEAWNHGMDPFPFSRKAYSVGDSIAYEAQLVASIINTRAPIEGRPSYEYEGEGEKLRCTVTCKLIDDPVIKSVQSPEIGKITTKNSPLWKTDPEQQLGYYTIRNWARRYCPEILLGIYDVDEMEEVDRAERARDVTPKTAPSAPPPQRSEFTSSGAQADEPQEGATEQSVSALILEIEKALTEAVTRADLASVWNVASTDGDLDRIANEDAAAHQKLCQLYNGRSDAFDQEASEAEEQRAGDDAKKAPPAPAGEAAERFRRNDDGEVYDNETGEVVPSQFVRSFQNGGFSVLKGYHEHVKAMPEKTTDAEEEKAAEAATQGGSVPEDAVEQKPAATAAETFTVNSIAKVATFKKGNELNNWFDNTFTEEAAARDLDADQVERVRQARIQRLREISPTKK